MTCECADEPRNLLPVPAFRLRRGLSRAGEYLNFALLSSDDLLSVDATRRRAIGQILLLAAGFVVLIAISVASVVLVNRAREDNGLVVHTVEVENQINTVLLEIRRAESAARGYLLTYGPQFLADHENALASAVPDLDRLAQLTSDDPVQTEHLRKLRPAIERRLSQFAQEMDLIKR